MGPPAIDNREDIPLPSFSPLAWESSASTSSSLGSSMATPSVAAQPLPQTWSTQDPYLPSTWLDGSGSAFTIERCPETSYMSTANILDTWYSSMYDAALLQQDLGLVSGDAPHSWNYLPQNCNQSIHNWDDGYRQENSFPAACVDALSTPSSGLYFGQF